ncbi:recombinase family protein [Methylomonas paludis]|uniref:Recombinase family protein n=1 Tax=Methylomonas paludis TaxID=1173101 RepID=A0A975R7V6_9GAMM|nr:recombinase family protein [Methylomonas paludis]QWF69665.1 recombinase family protein [Methylomonas paludis]
MKGQHIGYIRVSSTSQNTERQLADVQLDRTFTDKASGKDANRPELSNCLNHLREGDVLHVHSIDRLARNLKDLQTLIETLTLKGVTVKFYKEHLTFEAAHTSPMQTLMLQMLGAFAEFERTLIKERQREGIEAAKAQGKKLGAPAKLTADQVATIKVRIEQGQDKSKVAKDFGISRPTLYKLLAA